MALVIYTKPGCPYCQQARDHYNASGSAFVEYDAQNDKARQREMLAFSNDDPTVPCIVKDGVYLGSGWAIRPAAERFHNECRQLAGQTNFGFGIADCGSSRSQVLCWIAI